MSFAASDVLRGMEVHGVPRRLLRERGTIAREEPVPQPQVEDDPRRKGFEEGRAHGWEEGLRTGQEEGRRIVQQELDALARAQREKLAAQSASTLRQSQEQLDQLARSLGAAVDDCLAAAEDELVVLCFECVCAVLGSFALAPEQIREQVRLHAGTPRMAGEALTVRLHPHDAGLVAEAVAKWPPTLRCQADAEVALGGCIVVGPRGALDLRLETMLAGLKDTLLRVRAARVPGIGAPP
jgi:flagellar assembly protein FliH